MILASLSRLSVDALQRYNWLFLDGWDQISRLRCWRCCSGLWAEPGKLQLNLGAHQFGSYNTRLALRGGSKSTLLLTIRRSCSRTIKLLLQIKFSSWRCYTTPSVLREGKHMMTILGVSNSSVSCNPHDKSVKSGVKRSGVSSRWTW